LSAVAAVVQVHLLLVFQVAVAVAAVLFSAL
jgi:hypothetical protein